MCHDPPLPSPGQREQQYIRVDDPSLVLVVEFLQLKTRHHGGRSVICCRRTDGGDDRLLCALEQNHNVHDFSRHAQHQGLQLAPEEGQWRQHAQET
ncbi:unnamed protein product [Ectocarpus sp. 12 AP-2014]